MRVTSRDKTLANSKAQRVADFIAQVKADIPKHQHTSVDWLVAVLNVHPRMVEALTRLLDSERKDDATIQADVDFAFDVLEEVRWIP